MSLLPFCALTLVVPLLSMEGKRALGFHQKYLNLCSEDELRSYGFVTTWGWVINDRIFIFGWTIPLISHICAFVSLLYYYFICHICNIMSHGCDFIRYIQIWIFISYILHKTLYLKLRFLYFTIVTKYLKFVIFSLLQLYFSQLTLYLTISTLCLKVAHSYLTIVILFIIIVI